MTADQLSDRLAIGNPALLDAFLRLGAALGELRYRAGCWGSCATGLGAGRCGGRRSNALAAPDADTMRAMVEETLH